MRAAVVTVSTSKASGRGEDESGPVLVAVARGLGAEIAGTDLVADNREQIEARLIYWSDAQGCDLVLTTGGTGFAPSDVTPEATRAVIERETPGIPEAMRSASRAHTRHWMLSRALAGIRGRTLIINFPGSPASIDQAAEPLRAAVPHAVALVSGRPGGHATH
ncbi:MAG: MogA/MoaB family molybdenum cofactor biosynthesis protein [Actinomycetota bacterium]|nr:MogA/MoaB family molybdenum cofactor biosynthesis protein [Actinomycetota bacterium]